MTHEHKTDGRSYLAELVVGLSLLLGLIVVITLSLAQRDKLELEISGLHEALDAEKSNERRLHEEIAGLKSDIQRCLTVNDALDAENDELEERAELLKRELAECRKQLADDLGPPVPIIPPPDVTPPKPADPPAKIEPKPEPPKRICQCGCGKAGCQCGCSCRAHPTKNHKHK